MIDEIHADWLFAAIVNNTDLTLCNHDSKCYVALFAFTALSSTTNEDPANGEELSLKRKSFCFSVLAAGSSTVSLGFFEFLPSLEGDVAFVPPASPVAAATSMPMSLTFNNSLQNFPLLCPRREKGATFVYLAGIAFLMISDSMVEAE